MDIKLIRPGFFTTVQDLGRTGYQQYGMSQCGAMDAFSLQLANVLVGNAPGEAGLEITITGPEIEFFCNATIAICGADLSPAIQQKPVEMNCCVQVGKGEILQFGALKNGCRAYLAIRGGLDVPLIMGSKSTDVKAGAGGLKGRALKAGDAFAVGNNVQRPPIKDDVHLPFQITKGLNEIAVLPGPEVSFFSQQAIRTFLTTNYTVGSESNRMGYRLEGESLEFRNQASLLSSGVALGTVQVPPGGRPIVLMADRQATGGYPRIANVISADIPRLAQLIPGEQIRFVEVTMEQANEQLGKLQNCLKNLENLAR